MERTCKNCYLVTLLDGSIYCDQLKRNVTNTITIENDCPLKGIGIISCGENKTKEGINTMEKLKPNKCSRCGGRASIIELPDRKGGKIFEVYCVTDKIECYKLNVLRRNKEEAITVWNQNNKEEKR